MDVQKLQVAVVIPSFRVRAHVFQVLEAMGPEVSRIYVVDDACPEDSGSHVEQCCKDPRVRVIRHAQNLGVGGAVMTGYRAALADGADIIVKVDGDGQMDPRLIPDFVAPIAMGEADYTKGNRFFNLDGIRAMPGLRLFGNAVLSFMSKLSTGYWDLFDPTNGYTAIHRDVATQLPFGKVSHRYFFETDMLFRLNTIRAVVVDVPMEAQYGNERSSLRISRILGEFLAKHARNFIKRIFYNYYLRDMSVASLELPIGVLMLIAGFVKGGYHWLAALQSGVPTPTGTVVLSALLIIVGMQFLLAFLAFDISSVPRRPLQRRRRGSCLRQDIPSEPSHSSLALVQKSRNR